ncbi:MAG: polyphosphate polymerase domain-containing protein [Flavobacteriaceae bacterium]|nr:polyphosphate polymerase domain-containing protein [Formosa sp.]MDG2498905.1 polyphosphate polymerase domain-containing protein [Flavobacteriaceae bacterium]
MDASKLSGFASISLEEMNGVSLLKRVDTKFLTSGSELSKLLPLLYSDYRILEIDGNRLMNYSTLYFDTKDFRCYMEHHNGKAKRHKIRIRRYVESDICFLEVKEKQNSGMTNKVRCSIDDFESNLSPKSKKFIEKATKKEWELEPALHNYFKRFTLVNTQRSERVTIDTGIEYKTNSTAKTFKNVVVIEVKQEKQNTRTPIYSTLKSNRIRTVSFSKYCMGIANIFEGVKSNKFKELNLKINQLNN